MLSFECIKNEKSVYFLLTSAVLAHSRLKTAAINQQVHLPPTKKSPYGLFFTNSFYIRRS